MRHLSGGKRSKVLGVYAEVEHGFLSHVASFGIYTDQDVSCQLPASVPDFVDPSPPYDISASPNGTWFFSKASLAGAESIYLCKPKTGGSTSPVVRGMRIWYQTGRSETLGQYSPEYDELLIIKTDTLVFQCDQKYKIVHVGESVNPAVAGSENPILIGLNEVTTAYDADMIIVVANGTLGNMVVVHRS